MTEFTCLPNVVSKIKHNVNRPWIQPALNVIKCSILQHLSLPKITPKNPCTTMFWQVQRHLQTAHTHTHTHTRLTALCPGLPGWAGTRKVKPVWILLKQETVSGSGISWAICKSAPCSRQITTPAPHHSVFYRLDALPAAQPTASKQWRQDIYNQQWLCNHLNPPPAKVLQMSSLILCFDVIGWEAGRASGL